MFTKSQQVMRKLKDVSWRMVSFTLRRWCWNLQIGCLSVKCIVFQARGDGVKAKGIIWRQRHREGQKDLCFGDWEMIQREESEWEIRQLPSFINDLFFPTHPFGQELEIMWRREDTCKSPSGYIQGCLAETGWKDVNFREELAALQIYLYI